MNLPNKLTLSRLILAIPFSIFLIIPLYYGFMPKYEDWTWKTTMFLIATIIFIFAMFTDFIDGKLARKNNQVTTFGQIFDPIADKIMTNIALVVLAVYQIVPLWLVIPIIMRDLIVDGLRSFAATNNIVVPASNWGKIKTMILSLALVLLFVWSPTWNGIDLGPTFPGHPGTPISTYGNWLLNTPLIMATLVSLWSGVLYIKELKGLIKFK